MASSASKKVVVIGAGIGGLTAAALLAHRGYPVKVFDQAIVPGGCASTFKRRGFTFDVGATQVAGLESGGIHHQIFEELGIDLPPASECDPACAVFLPGETEPINVWRDAQKWKAERERQFPGSAPFWAFMKAMFDYSWRFQQRDPVLPPRNLWDVWQLTKALRPDTLLTVPFTFSTVGDILKGYDLYENRRLRTFLDMQLKLYSQTTADKTAALYAATALGVSQAPHGLFHLKGSMQVLSDRLLTALEKNGGELYMRHKAEAIKIEEGNPIQVKVTNKQGESWLETADHVVANVTVQNLVKLADSNKMNGYQKRVKQLPSSSGAFVIYLGVEQSAVPDNCPPHLQFLYDYDGPIAENNSLFVSVSRAGDGRAPAGKATIIASSFTDVQPWDDCDKEEYKVMKDDYTQTAISRLKDYFDLRPEHLVHVEAATPRSFETFTGRSQGIVGGIGQRVPTFGPFGFATRTPVQNLWLVGDSTHPGEGTAGVSYSAMTAVRQIEERES
ncbi:C-3',4' desaturase CrtD [cf. Phormidesmis sp. LEGE 11477]|uniref:C-3',4' desaturase CrtD n=1 Tax=cf. Phormidesmis sp. LEGE 11477 TaxID=1828680 RepID=UPI001881C5CF|nr:C-3',4' desaturase CrtD [cf. Phormidesmis sp. LEGE 11477]MBE9059674.1 C-3',4' desaturase CrtD [cf. Phormidesmis sp. LEGE 11477]